MVHVFCFLDIDKQVLFLLQSTICFQNLSNFQVKHKSQISIYQLTVKWLLSQLKGFT